MTIIYTVDAFDRVDELLVFEVEVPKEKLPEISKVMGWTKEDYNDFVAGLGAGTLLIKKMKVVLRFSQLQPGGLSCSSRGL
jgi:hypothetical protein